MTTGKLFKFLPFLDCHHLPQQTHRTVKETEVGGLTQLNFLLTDWQWTCDPSAASQANWERTVANEKCINMDTHARSTKTRVEYIWLKQATGSRDCSCWWIFMAQMDEGTELKAREFLYCSRITFKTRSHFVFHHHLYYTSYLPSRQMVRLWRWLGALCGWKWIGMKESGGLKGRNNVNPILWTEIWSMF